MNNRLIAALACAALLLTACGGAGEAPAGTPADTAPAAESTSAAESTLAAETSAETTKAAEAQTEKTDDKTESVSEDAGVFPQPSSLFSGETELIQSADRVTAIGALPEAFGKKPENNNPLISNVFCADPTSIEHEGRLYVYGSNDQQQYDKPGGKGENSYEHIKTLVTLSTDDMANWTYHGNIQVKKISPWVTASWAPSIVSRVEEDGLTHFYLYYSNSGGGVGMLTSTSPTGPWSDPLRKPLIDNRTPGLNGCNVPFDPGVVIDDDGVGWITFGGLAPDAARIAKLGSDMMSLDGDIQPIHSPHHFEASELNFINGTYVYTYCSDWEQRNDWNIEGKVFPPICSMAYMTSKTPLDPDSWVYENFYFKNPGEQGLEYGNNHTHLQKYEGKYYLFYHSMFPQKDMQRSGGFRSLCVNEAVVDEENVKIERVTGNKKGVSQIKPLDPYTLTEGETMAASSGIKYNAIEEGLTVTGMTVSAEDGKDCGWILVKGADFGGGASRFAAQVSGSGRIEIRAGSLDNEAVPAAALEFDTDEPAVICTDNVNGLSGEQDIYILLTSGVTLDKWQFEK